MNLIIGLIVSVLLIVVSCVVYMHAPEWAEMFSLYVGAFAAIIGVSLLMCVIFVPILQKIDTEEFKQQSEWFRQHEVVSEYEDVAITQAKIELNKWLFSAKATMDNYPGWHFYPDEVADLEPIR